MFRDISAQLKKKKKLNLTINCTHKLFLATTLPVVLCDCHYTNIGVVTITWLLTRVQIEVTFIYNCPDHGVFSMICCFSQIGNYTHLTLMSITNTLGHIFLTIPWDGMDMCIIVQMSGLKRICNKHEINLNLQLTWPVHFFSNAFSLNI